VPCGVSFEAIECPRSKTMAVAQVPGNGSAPSAKLEVLGIVWRLASATSVVFFVISWSLAIDGRVRRNKAAVGERHGWTPVASDGVPCMGREIHPRVDLRRPLLRGATGASRTPSEPAVRWRRGPPASFFGGDM